MQNLTNQYPHLFRQVTWAWGPIQAHFVSMDEVPANNLIANVNFVPRIGKNWVAIQFENGSWEIPGGTIEPGEAFLDTVCRELEEEVGAQMISCCVIGAWDCASLADKPYRPHLPFPRFYRLVLAGEINIVGMPKISSGGENAISVECVPLGIIVERFKSQGRFDLAELYQLTSRFYFTSSKKVIYDQNDKAQKGEF